MSHYKLRNSLLLLLTATIWGISFVAQSVGLEYIDPFTFNGIRLVMGGCVLLPVIAVRSRLNPVLAMQKGADAPAGTQVSLVAGILCGLVLFVASNLQQYGLMYTTAGKSGFITAFYIILVPVASLFFLRQKNSPLLWLSVGIALAGLYLISMQGDRFAMGRGELLTFIGALFYTAHILVIDHFAPTTDGVRMSCIQFFVSGALSLACALLFERHAFSMHAILAAWKPLLYSGVLSAGVGYTLQIVGQKGLNPSVASLLMSMESCVSVIAGWLILGQALSRRELAGCGLMLFAIILADLLPFFSERDRTRHSRRSVSG